MLKGVQDELSAHGVSDDTRHLQDLDEFIFKSKRLLVRLDKAERGPGAKVTPPPFCTSTKSKLESCVPTFKGDILMCLEFWDLFTVAVHDNPQYSQVEKFVLARLIDH